MTGRLLMGAPSLRDDSETTLFKRILFVESDSHIANEVREALDLHFYDVTVVPTGPLAIRAVMQENFDALLCDATIPNFPAEMFYHAVSRVRPDLCKRFISITSASQKLSRNIGALSIWKPIDMQILLEAVQGVLRKNQAATDALASQAA